MRTHLIAIALLSIAVCARAATYTVLPNGTGDFPTIQAALYAATGGDVIQLGNGTFTGPGNRNLDTNETNISLVSASGNPALCVIDCQGSAATPHYGISYSTQGPGTLLRGISIINGYSDPVGGALQLADAHITVENCVFADNTARNFGGAVAALDGSAPTFRNCVFRDNSAVYYGQGGAVYFAGTSSPLITGCAFAGNAADLGGAVYFSAGSPSIVSSTFFYNLPGALYVNAGCSVNLSKTILAYNRGPGGVVTGSGQAQLTCCDIYGNHGGDWIGSIAGQFGLNGNISADPQMIDPWLGNFNIATTSPCGTYVNPACGRIGVGYVVAQAPTYVLKADALGMLPTIQAAVDVAPAGSVISLEDGVYTGLGNRDISLRGKLLRVEGRSGNAASAVIDAQGAHATPRRAFHLFSGEPAGTTLQHLTLRGGYTNEDAGAPSGGKGGAIRMSAGSSLTVLDCAFEDNTVYRFDLVFADVGRAGAIDNDGGGDLWLQDCTFVRNSADQAILHTGGRLTVLSCTFSDNPGCVEARSATGAINLAGCIFSDFAEKAVICSSVAESIRIYSCSFTAPGFLVDRAVGISDCESVMIEQCQFSQLVGGSWLAMAQPLVVINRSNVGILDSIFDGNGGGSALSLGESTSQVTNCAFTDNAATSTFSVIRVVGGAVGFTNCNFVDNAPGFDSTVSVEAATATFDQCQFTGNHTSGRGAACYFEASTVTLQATGFTNNTASEGGGFYADRCNLTVADCTFDGNSDGLRHHGSSLGGVTITGTTFANHTSGYAAQIDSMLTRPVVFDNCAFSANTQGLRLFQVPNFRLANTAFSDNPDSGALEISYASGAVDTCTFDRNGTGQSGGAMTLDNADVGVKDCTFADNFAGTYGGAVHLDTAYASLTRCRFDRNSTTRAGGAVAGFTSSAILSNCDFDANVAGQSEGAVLFNGSDVRLTFCTLSGNSAAIYAGGAMFYRCDPVVIDRCVITGNSAGIVGGLGINECASVQIEGTTIANNVTPNSGSGLAVYNGSSVNIQGSTIVGNGGEGSSGQVYINQGSNAVLTNSIIALGTAGPGVAQGFPLSTITVQGCDVFGNAGGDWVGPLAGLNGVACNFSRYPQFCDPATGDYHLVTTSPCAAANNACAQDVGALGVGCTGASPVLEAELPRNFAVLGNAPNPFNPSTEISFELSVSGPVALEIYDVAGRRIRQLMRGGELAAGRHRATWDGNDDQGRAQTSGVYLYRVEAEGRALTGKMALLR